MIIQKTSIMSVMKVIEVMADSTKSWEDAATNAVNHAAKSIKHIRSAFVQSQSMVVNNGKVERFRVNVKITFEVK
jgi:flavin-binding protein dodecin